MCGVYVCVYVCVVWCVCSVVTINKNEGIKVVNESLVEVEKCIKGKGGLFLLQTKPTVLGENEESISEQLPAFTR